MNLIELAKQAGWDAHHAEFDTRIQTFAALVEATARADEREACAKVCDNRTEELYASRDTVDCAEWLANEIRARARGRA